MIRTKTNTTLGFISQLDLVVKLSPFLELMREPTEPKTKAIALLLSTVDGKPLYPAYKSNLVTRQSSSLNQLQFLKTSAVNRNTDTCYYSFADFLNL